MSVPPPVPPPNLSAPPPNLTTINTVTGGYQHRFGGHRDGNRGFFKPFRPYHAPKVIAGGQDALQDEFDGKRLRKSVMRKTVDYNAAIIKTLEVKKEEEKKPNIMFFFLAQFNFYFFLLLFRIVYGSGITETEERCSLTLYTTRIYCRRQATSIIQ